MNYSLLSQTSGRCPSSKPFCFVNIMHAFAVERASLINPLPGTLHSITGLVQLDLFLHFYHYLTSQRHDDLVGILLL